MSLKHCLPVAFLTILFSGCSNNHLIVDNEYRNIVETAFIKKQNLAVNRKEQLFSVFKKNLDQKQVEALKFLYAFMPLNDIAEFDGDFFLSNADVALRTRYGTPWGEKIPDHIFLHYVLPCRVNNENLDSFRIAYEQEIAERIKGLDIVDASLEINHWCHEKVTYQPSDIRTSGPMSTILSARGRCGEESTFTVSALRTAGIPARQVYTPRWAHTDDNHAWVEVWIDGKWYYMGACEPEPRLDIGWFTEPARRAMLVHTKSFGAPYGHENAINASDNFTEVNNLAKYAVVKKIFVKVVDEHDNPVEGADIEYQLYNYSEFYPLAVVPTDSRGYSSFETGLGDLLIWARKNNEFNYSKISAATTDTLIMRLDAKAEGDSSEDIDLAVPVLREPPEGLPEDLIEKNARRIETENNIRKSYTDSWIKPAEAVKFALEIGSDTTAVAELLAKSMGNYKTILSFLKETPEKERELAVKLLQTVSEKDLRDTRKEILSDHLENCINLDNHNISDEMFVKYVLNPRIDNEILKQWRGFLIKNLPARIITEAPHDPSLLIDYINSEIKVSNEENHYKTPLTPSGVHELKISDSHSREIYFIAVCRSIGIPARLEAGSMIPQFFAEDKWNDVLFADQVKPSGNKGYLKLVSDDTNPVPQYYVNFTIARFENGRYNTLEYEYGKKVSGFDEELKLSPGHYMLVTGNRINDGRILANISFFNLAEGQHKTLNIHLRHEETVMPELGKAENNALKKMMKETGIAETEFSGSEVVLAWVNPEKEPTKHFFNDLLTLRKELDSWGGLFLFLTDNETEKDVFIIRGIEGFPKKSFSIVDNHMDHFRAIIGEEPPAVNRFPLIFLTDRNGIIRYKSVGYHIGTGEQILKNATRQ